MLAPPMSWRGGAGPTLAQAVRCANSCSLAAIACWDALSRPAHALDKASQLLLEVLGLCGLVLQRLRRVRSRPPRYCGILPLRLCAPVMTTSASPPEAQVVAWYVGCSSTFQVCVSMLPRNEEYIRNTTHAASSLLLHAAREVPNTRQAH